MPPHFLRAAAIALLLGAGLATANGAPPTKASTVAAPAAEAAALPAMQSTGALHYACGGIGSDESIAMRAAMKKHPLSLLFARKDGDYLANLSVVVQPDNGQALRFTAGGPICLLQLPTGSYTVTATTQDGMDQSQQIHVSHNGHTLDFRY